MTLRTFTTKLDQFPTFNTSIKTLLSVKKVSKQVLLDEILLQLLRNLPKDVRLAEDKIYFIGSGCSNSSLPSFSRSSSFPKGTIYINSDGDKYSVVIRVDYSLVFKVVFLISWTILSIAFFSDSIRLSAYIIAMLAAGAFLRIAVDVIALRSLVKSAIKQMLPNQTAS